MLQKPPDLFPPKKKEGLISKPISIFGLRSGYPQKSEKIIICAFGFEKNGRKSSFFRSGFPQIILKNPLRKTAMTFETDAHL